MGLSAGLAALAQPDSQTLRLTRAALGALDARTAWNEWFTHEANPRQRLGAHESGAREILPLLANSLRALRPPIDAATRGLLETAAIREEGRWPEIDAALARVATAIKAAG